MPKKSLVALVKDLAHECERSAPSRNPALVALLNPILTTAKNPPITEATTFMHLSIASHTVGVSQRVELCLTVLYGNNDAVNVIEIPMSVVREKDPAAAIHDWQQQTLLGNYLSEIERLNADVALIRAEIAKSSQPLIVKKAKRAKSVKVETKAKKGERRVKG